MTIRTKLLVIEALSQLEGAFLANVDFPLSPLNPFGSPGAPPAPFTIEGVSYVPVMAAWEIDIVNAASEAILVLRVMTQANAEAAQKTMKLMQGGGSMRQGASGPILDLNAMRRAGDS